MRGEGGRRETVDNFGEKMPETFIFSLPRSISMDRKTFSNTSAHGSPNLKPIIAKKKTGLVIRKSCRKQIN